MRIIACIVAVLGGIVGALTGVFQLEAHSSYAWITMAMSLLGALGGVLVLMRWRFSTWWLLFVALAGAFPDSILWEGAGSFFLVSALMSLSLRGEKREA